MANATVQQSLAEIWSKEATAWRVGYYLLMPDHLHFFCAPHDLHFDIDAWVEFWKRQFSRRHLDQPWSWQRKSFHHRLRNRIEYEEKLAYVRENPLRKKLAEKPEEWPYQGRIHDLRWWGCVPPAPPKTSSLFQNNGDDVDVVPIILQRRLHTG